MKAAKEQFTVEFQGRHINFNSVGIASSLCSEIFKEGIPEDFAKIFSSHLNGAYKDQNTFDFSIAKFSLSENSEDKKAIFLKFNIYFKGKPFMTRHIEMTEEMVLQLLDAFRICSQNYQGENFTAFMVGVYMAGQAEQLKFVCLLMTKLCEVWNAGIEASEVGMTCICTSFKMELKKPHEFNYSFKLKLEGFENPFEYGFKLQFAEMPHFHYVTKFQQLIINEMSQNANNQNAYLGNEKPTQINGKLARDN